MNKHTQVIRQLGATDSWNFDGNLDSDIIDGESFTEDGTGGYVPELNTSQGNTQRLSCVQTAENAYVSHLRNVAGVRSVSCQIKLERASSGSYSPIFLTGDYTSAFNVCTLYVHDYSSTTFALYMAGSSQVFTSNTLYYGVDYHVICSKDADNSIRLYINNEFDVLGYSSSWFDHTIDSIILGGRASVNQAINGELKNLAFFDYPLTADNRVQLYGACIGIGKPSIQHNALLSGMGFYLDYKSDTNEVISDEPTVSESGVVTATTPFSNTSTFATYPANAFTLHTSNADVLSGFEANNDAFIEVWFRTASILTESSLIKVGALGDTINIHEIMIDDTRRLGVKLPNGTIDWSGDTFTYNEWVQVVLSKSGNSFTLFINGAQNHTPITIAYSTMSQFDINIHNNNASSIDYGYVMIGKQALSLADVQTNYSELVSGLLPNPYPPRNVDVTNVVIVESTPVDLFTVIALDSETHEVIRVMPNQVAGSIEVDVNGYSNVMVVIKPYVGEPYNESYNYSIGDLVVPTDVTLSNTFHKVTQSGVSGVEPLWDDTTTTGTVTFNKQGDIVRPLAHHHVYIEQVVTYD